ncbi:MAG: ATP-dependent metallopeptidase FtsH/Yme1/Tma family protein [Clostridia bacterium]|nr:ATP-dependent metallopeptidase FtsH/Yme1/Tma family protein [Clostridia bacterium]
MLIIAYLIYSFFVTMNSAQIKMSYSDLINQIKSEQIAEMTVSGNTVTAKLTNGQKEKVTILSLESLQSDAGEEMNAQMERGSLKVESYETKISWAVITNILLIIVFVFVLVFGFMRKGGGGAANFTRSRAKLNINNTKVTFKDVAGADEEKAELAEIVEFLKNPHKFIALGARIPKGVLLVGTPGTGKTLLAKAVAGEAGVPFFSISGSDFVELYVGVGASRVRDLFEQAKKNRPCIVFIDEIDAVGRKRGAGMGGGHDEREQTLNQLLVEMDGFGENDGVIIIAATNRPDILDKALLRPGRFDRQIVVDTPDMTGREAILKVHSEKKPLAKDVNLSEIAKATVGYSGADLENLMNEAAIFAARRNHIEITGKDIEDANLKVMMGSEKRSRVITEKEKRLTAFHEAGHAVISKLVDKASHIHKVSIIPRGRAGGFTMDIPNEDKMYRSKNEMLNEILVFLGGRVAEELTMDDISTGASNDIQRATELVRNMVTKYGMSDSIGPVSYDENGEVFIGRDFAHSKTYSEKTAAEIDDEVKRIITTQYQKTKQILNDNMDILTRVANKLLEKETIDSMEFEKCFNKTEGGNENADN